MAGRDIRYGKLFGDRDKLIIGLLQLAALVCLLIAGQAFGLGLFYYLGLASAAALFVYHQVLISTREPALCFKAFLKNSWVGAVVFLGIVLHYALSV